MGYRLTFIWGHVGSYPDSESRYMANERHGIDKRYLGKFRHVDSASGPRSPGLSVKHPCCIPATPIQSMGLLVRPSETQTQEDKLSKFLGLRGYHKLVRLYNCATNARSRTSSWITADQLLCTDIPFSSAVHEILLDYASLHPEQNEDTKL